MGRGNHLKIRRGDANLPPKKRISVIEPDWVRNSVSMKTRYTQSAVSARKKGKQSYDDDLKVDDPIKSLANSFLCAKARDLQEYYKSIIPCKDEADAAIGRMRYLTLDSLYLGTTTRFVKDCGVSLSQIYICSEEIEFEGDGRNKKNSYTGKLNDYLRSISRSDVIFDVVYLDFCGNLSKENMDAVELLFKKRLLDVVGIFAITLSYRCGNKTTSYNREHTFGGILSVVDLAKKYGYHLGNIDPVENVPHGMSTYVCKFIEIKRALDHKEGLNLDGNRYGPDNWVLRTVPNLPVIDEERVIRNDSVVVHKDEEPVICDDEEEMCDDDESDEEDDDQFVINDGDENEEGPYLMSDGDDDEVGLSEREEDVEEEDDVEDDEEEIPVEFVVGDDVSVCLTGLMSFSGFRHCHMDGKILSIDRSKFRDMYVIYLPNIKDTIKVHIDRLSKVRGGSVDCKWEQGDSVQVEETPGEWWEATIVGYNAKKKVYKIEWETYGNIVEMPADKIRQ